MKRRWIWFVISLYIVLTLLFIGCAGDPIDELYIEELVVEDTLEVGEDRSLLPLLVGGAYFDAGIIVRTEHGGIGQMTLGHNAAAPIHEGEGSFDFTGGAYENLFTATANVFAAEDAEVSNWIIITSGAYTGATAEIELFIDATHVVVHTSWMWDIAVSDFVIINHPIFASTTRGHVHIDTKSHGDFHVHSYDHMADCLVHFEMNNAADDLSALCIEMDASGFSDSEAIRVRYNTGALQPADLLSLLKISLNDVEAVASDATTHIDLIELLTLDQEDATKHAIHVGQGFDIAFVVSGGTEEDPDHGYEVTPDVPVDRVNGIAPDGTAFLDVSASDLTIFDAENDYILIGSDAIFEAIVVVLDTGANRDIDEDYYYSTGAGTWAALVVADTVDGFQQSGIITFEAPGAWALSNATVPAGAAINNAFYIKIERMRVHVGIPPIEAYFKTYSASSTTDFEIRGDGTIRPVEMADAAAPNNSLYFSTTQNKLVYKDNGGVVHDLW